MHNMCACILLALSIPLLALGQEVKISHFGAGSGDSTLIVIKDCVKRANPNDPCNLKTVTLLIDTGSRKEGLFKYALPKRMGEKIPDQIDIFILSQLDQDHIRGAGHILSELVTRRIKAEKSKDQTELAKTEWITKLTLYDRITFTEKSDATYLNFTTKSTDAYFEYKVARKKLKDLAGRKAATPFDKGVAGDKVTPALKTGSDILISYNLENAQMITIASNGVIGDQLRVKPNGADENDLCFAFLLRFGTFRYYTGGDLAGSGPKYTNMEKPLSVWLKNEWETKHPTSKPFHVCAAKVGHHGSETSFVDKHFLQFFDPRIAVIPAANRIWNKETGARHPARETVERLLGVALPVSQGAPVQRLVLCTFRFETVIDPITVAWGKWKLAKTRTLQDIVLHIDDSALRAGMPPTIRIFRRERIRKTLAPTGTKAGPNPTYDRDIPVILEDGSNEFKCPRPDHGKLELPSTP